jgi:hypothetical protein
MTKLLSFLKATVDELLWTLGMLLAQSLVLLSRVLEYMTAGVSALYMHSEKQPSRMTASHIE